MAIDAAIFDLDGVLVDTEPTWTDVRRRFVLAEGGRWPAGAAEAMQGMATAEWAAYLHDELGVGLPADEVATRVIDAMASALGSSPPLVPGAVSAVRRLAARWPLGLASSSPARLIAHVLAGVGVTAGGDVAGQRGRAGRLQQHAGQLAQLGHRRSGQRARQGDDRRSEGCRRGARARGRARCVLERGQRPPPSRRPWSGLPSGRRRGWRKLTAVAVTVRR